MSLYSSHRPQIFSDFFGQEEVISTIKKQLTSAKESHAYLFVGPRGTGKTTTARIIAKVLNCESPKEGEPCNKCFSCVGVNSGSNLDVLEIDAASNRGIDEIRDLREKIKLSPTLGKYKVYIIDEVHMLTIEAFNALLKTLEEPPKHAIFILCTTESHKVPATIISRCLKFEFKKATLPELQGLLKKVAKKEKIELDPEGAQTIASAAEGSFRDALTILEQVSSGGAVTAERVGKLTGRRGEAEKLLNLVKDGNTYAAIEYLNTIYLGGGSLSYLVEELVRLLREDLLQSVEAKNTENQKLASRFLRVFSKAHVELKLAVIPTLPLELAIVDVSVKEEPKVPELQLESNVINNVEMAKDVPVGKSSNELSSLKGNWDNFLRAIKPYNHSLEAFLRGCEPVEFSGKIITLRFFYKFHKDMVDQTKNKAIVEKKLGEIVGGEVKVKTILGEKAPHRKVVTEEVKNISEVSDDDLVQKAVDIFNSGVN